MVVRVDLGKGEDSKRLGLARVCFVKMQIATSNP